ncbi:uncharacterized protein LOC124383754 [Silurus meridionalis]|uniref:uncharacterized protein LOC124383754 n=1 Tax=Silurus meridionalis TaxID=175797 RepID=UPI001EEBDE1E|nr:uncharacterized protein LOC124383754 [Silurus meridionalis]
MAAIVLLLLTLLGTGLPVQAHPHDNTFWQFANWTARQHTNESCYVCQAFPMSTTATSLKPRNDTLTDTLVAMAHICITDTCISQNHTYASQNYTHWSYLNHTGSRWCQNNTDKSTCISALRTTLKMDTRSNAYIPGFQAFQGPNHQYVVCMERNSSTILGKLARKSCNQTYVERRGKNATGCSLHPGENGTTWKQDWYWVCGKRVYLYLPTGWGGRCAYTRFSAHLSIILHNRTHNVRHKRDATDQSFPPPEHQLKTKLAKFGDVFFPRMGVTHLWNQIEVTHYRLATFANETIRAIEGVRTELTALRLTAVQNRLALDMLLAARGGVCAVIGDSCCTFIPAHDDAHGEISQAVEKMRNTIHAIKEDEQGDKSGWGIWYVLFGQWTPYLSMVVPV